MTPENKKTMIWTAGVIVGLVVIAAIVLLATGAGTA
jgi:hypothetical protein